MELKKRPVGDFRLYQEEVELYVPLHFNENIGSYECGHFPVRDGRWESKILLLKESDPKLGLQVRGVSLCLNCWRLLKEKGVVTWMGIWDV